MGSTPVLTFSSLLVVVLLFGCYLLLMIKHKNDKKLQGAATLLFILAESVYVTFTYLLARS